MLDSLRVLIADSLPTVPAMDKPVTPRDVRVAACAMMLQVAFADGRMTKDERQMITRSLIQHFGVDGRGAEEIMSAAESQMNSGEGDEDFARRIVAEYDEDQRIMLGEMLHQIASADGWLSGNEEFVLGKIEEMLGVERGAFVKDVPND